MGGRGRGGGRLGGRGSNSENSGAMADLQALILGPSKPPGPGGSRAPQKIIIPGGQPKPSGGGASLIVPEGGSGLGASDVIGESITTPTPPSRYRPPAGFMNEEIDEDATASLDPQEMISKLRSKAARWYTLAKYIPSLYKQQYDSSLVDDLTGIAPVIQNKWVVAGTIHDSLKLKSSAMDPQVLAAFDSSDGADLLYPFRYLDVEFRVSAAKYLVEKKLNPDECEILARAMKEWERRDQERFGFSDHPGDCMAFKFLRDALETRSREDLIQKVEIGMKYAITDGARARLQEVLNPEEAAAKSESGINANMMLLRLNEDEIGYRTLPVLGGYEQTLLQDVERAPRATQDGPFGVFKMTGSAGDKKWVALPLWKALAVARHPVAIEVTDCSRVVPILIGTKARTDEERKRLRGPGLLVLDCGFVAPEDAAPETWYLASVSPKPEPSDKMELVDGGKLKASGRGASATVIFLCRPPARQQDSLTQQQAETSSLLQL